MTESALVQSLLARVEELEAEMRRMRDAGHARSPDAEPKAGEPMSRRHLLRNLGGAAAAGVGMAAGASVLTPTPAAAATGTWQYGTNTRIDAGSDGSGLKSSDASKTLVVENYGSGAAITAQSTTGVGVHAARGGAPTSDPSVAAVFAETDASTGAAVVARHRAGGWALRALSDGTGGSGVVAIAGGGIPLVAPSAGVDAVGGGDAYGVWAVSASTAAVYGESRGVESSTDPERGTGVYGVGAVGVFAEGRRSTDVPLRMAQNVGPADDRQYSRGSFMFQAGDGLIVCVVDGTPGTWMRVGFNPINPFRLVDTRETGGPIGANASRTFTVSPAGTAPNNVPAGTQGVSLNITVVGGTAASYVTVSPSDYTWATPDAPYSNVNFVAGQTAANQTTVKVGPDGKIKVFNRHGSVNVVIDVLGFFS